MIMIYLILCEFLYYYVCIEMVFSEKCTLCILVGMGNLLYSYSTDRFRYIYICVCLSYVI